MNEDNLPQYNFDYFDWILIRIIRKYYPDLKNKKELSLLSYIGWTMKDFNSLAALAIEVQLRMTENPTLGESNIYKPTTIAPPANLLLPEEYKDILSNLIGTKIVEQKIILTKYGSPPEQRLEKEEYLAFTNEDMTNEILGNSEVLDLASHHFISSMDVDTY